MNIVKIFSVILTMTFVIFSISTTALAAQEKFSLDENNSYVGFEVSYFFLMEVTGHFNDFEGIIIIDRKHPENSYTNLVVKTTSIDAGSKSRNKDIRGPALFNVDKYPEMIFHGDKIEIGPGNTALIRGNLTLLGVTRPLTLDLITGVPDVKSHETGNDNAFSDGFKITGKFKRSDFGMNGSSGPLGNVVDLFLCYKLEECNDE